MPRVLLALCLLFSACVTTEEEAKVQCTDGIDNDGDGLIDFGEDRGCSNLKDDSESPDPPLCGNDVIEAAEECDGQDLNGQSCQSLGLVGGTLACSSSCIFNTLACGLSLACNNQIDDDGDGLTDLSDPGCTASDDGDEDIFAPNCRGLGGPIFDVTFADTSVDVLVPGSTSGGTNNFGPSDTSDDCQVGTANGPEIVLLYRLLVAQTVTFSLAQSATNFDTVLYVRKNDCQTGIEFCNDDSGIFSKKSEITKSLTPGDYFIFIDGFNTEQGNFELLIDLAN